MDDQDSAYAHPVELLSPFRYPGGKTWLVPLIIKWLSSLNNNDIVFVEPFAGGASVGLNVIFHRLAAHLVLVEIDDEIAGVWETILGDNARQLSQRIASFRLTKRSVLKTMEGNGRSLSELAFRTILKNRINRGGILASGAGMLRRGEGGKGIRSRWYPETLQRRISKIAKMRQKITLIHGDGLEIISSLLDEPDHVFFMDPPYTVGIGPGARLYNHHELNHRYLFDLASDIKGNFMMTYRDEPKVRAWAKKHDMQTRRIQMRTAHHKNASELLIGKDLTWFDNRTEVHPQFASIRILGRSNSLPRPRTSALRRLL